MTPVCIAVLVIWFVVSAVSQLNCKPGHWLKARDFFSLIPNWSFFAPRPGTFDYHLVFRDIGTDGASGRWQELPLADGRTLLGAIWNAPKRSRKVLSDVVRGLVRLAQDKSRKDFSLTLPYLAILNYVSSLPRTQRPAETQFMILMSHGFYSSQEPRLVFMSSVHKL